MAATDNAPDKATDNHPDEPVARAPEDIKERLCLQCRRSFTSSWAGERVCPTCKSRTLWRSGRDWLPSGH
jgi:hypothetical protein